MQNHRITFALAAFCLMEALTLVVLPQTAHADGTATANAVSTKTAQASKTNTPTPTPIPKDWGDAPDTYNTTLSASGARHIITGLKLGSTIDAEPDGQPSIDADDDGPDEDGVAFSPGYASPHLLIPNTTATFAFSVTLGTATSAYLNAWIDYNDNGHWGDSGEWILSNYPIASSGTTNNSQSIPNSATETNATYMRVRLSSATLAGPTGIASDGEVEDYLIRIRRLDFGDAPDSGSFTPDPGMSPNYATTLIDNGARHLKPVPTQPIQIKLGVLVDYDANGQPSSAAQGDDYNDTDDEDGLFFPLQRIQACSNVDYRYSATSEGGVNVSGWFDANADGDWNDSDITSNSEHVITGTGGIVTGGFFSPCINTPGTVSTRRDTYARFRVSSDEGLDYLGEASDGEVEDYTLPLAPRTDIGCANTPHDQHVILVHGWPATGTPNCNIWSRVISDFKGFGWTESKIHTVKWWNTATNCQVNLGDFPAATAPITLTTGVPLDIDSFHLASYIKETFTDIDEPVDVMAHSVGGLLIRYALEYAFTERSRRPGQSTYRFPEILVEDVFTVATPHEGANYPNRRHGYRLFAICKTFWLLDQTQCEDLKHDSRKSQFFKYLHRESWYTKFSGTYDPPIHAQWTVVGDIQESDDIVHWSSSIGMPGARFKAVYDTKDHRHKHAANNEKPPQPPVHKNVSYLFDSGCDNSHSAWVQGYCNPDDDDPAGTRCPANMDQRPKKGRVGPFDNFCHWVNQPHTIRHASLALSLSDW